MMYIKYRKRGDNMGIGYRIKEAREALGLTQEELGQIIGVTGSSITNYEKETSHPKEAVMYKLIETLNVDANYLFQDAVKFSKKAELGKDDYELVEKYHSLDDFGRESVDTTLERELERKKILDKANKRIEELENRPNNIIELSTNSSQKEWLMNYFRSASAGTGVFILGNEATSKISVSDEDWNPDGDFVINVSGDSMIPLYNDGDKVIVSQRSEVLHGDIGIFVVNGTAYIKQYGENELISLNPAAKNIKISEYDNIVCMGKVIGKITGKYEIIND